MAPCGWQEQAAGQLPGVLTCQTTAADGQRCPLHCQCNAQSEHGPNRGRRGAGAVCTCACSKHSPSSRESNPKAPSSHTGHSAMNMACKGNPSKSTARNAGRGSVVLNGTAPNPHQTTLDRYPKAHRAHAPQTHPKPRVHHNAAVVQRKQAHSVCIQQARLGFEQCQQNSIAI